MRLIIFMLDFKTSTMFININFICECHCEINIVTSFHVKKSGGRKKTYIHTSSSEDAEGETTDYQTE